MSRLFIPNFLITFYNLENADIRCYGFLRPVYKLSAATKMIHQLQSNLDYPDLDYPDYSIIRTFSSGPNFFRNIN